MHITLVRHGETDENIKGIIQGQWSGPLNQTGIKQAEEIARILADESFDQIWSSDLLRAKQTAERIVQYHPGNKLELSEALREYSYGIYHGKPTQTLDWVKEEGEGLTRHTPGGENALDVAERASIFVNGLLQQDIQRVLLVTHGGTMRVIKALATGERLGPMFEIRPENTAIWKLEINNALNIEDLHW